MRTPPPSTRHRLSGPRAARTGGFTLVEVLVAVLVISIGMLGVARLVLAAVKANESAYFRTQAANLAYSMLDEIRANRDYAMTTTGYDVTLGNPPAAPTFNCLASYCTPAEIATYQVYDWEQRLASSGALPRGQGAISINLPGNPGQLPTATITITWDDSLAQQAFAPNGTVPATSTGTFTLESAL